MKRKVFSILFALVLVLSFSLVTAMPAAAADPPTIPSSTMVFESVEGYTLTYDSGPGTYSGMIPMVGIEQAGYGDGIPGYDIYAKEGASAWFGSAGPVWAEQVIADHNAWPGWDPNTPDWYQYSLKLYEDGGVQKWRVANHSGAPESNPWYMGGGSGAVEQGVPMSGVMDWTGMYAIETDVGEYLPPLDMNHGKIPGGAAAHGGGPGSWDMDWSWGSEVVPLQYPGFSVEVIPQGDSDYLVILTPAPLEMGFVTGGGWIDSPPHAYMPGPNGPDPAGTIVVTPSNVGVDWSTNDTRNNGYVEFVNGPGTPPLGVGSLEMGTTDGTDKAQLFNYDHMGTPLADIGSINYATYRDGSSANPLAQYSAINMEVDYLGDGSSYTTLVWEPIYAYGQSNLAVDTWQTWNAMAPSQTGFGGGWWSTKDIPGVCAFNCFVDWDTIVKNNPNAKIKYGFGVNVGSGWNGVFTGAVDALTLTVNGEATTYDFEPVAPPTGKATFGFVSKYKKGAAVPDGQTQFMFQTADLNFHSNSYEWLVVTGSNYARFKGTGTINGSGSYKFMLWAGDGSPDTFRIKIWTEESNVETVVYDNGMDQPIGGGQIVIHKSKK